MSHTPATPAVPEQPAVPEHYLFDGVLQAEELLWIYHKLLAVPSWSLARYSYNSQPALRPFMSFPGLEVETEGKPKDEFLSGYFNGLVYRIRALAMSRHGLKLPPRILRIHLGAKASTSKTEFHVDLEDENAWTILGFLNPEWNSADGGEFYLKDHRIEYRSGRFILFRSNTPHNGGFVTNPALTYWRIAVNVLLGAP